MTKTNAWKAMFFLCVLCAVEVIASPAQTFTTLVSFDGTNGAGPNGLVQGTDGNLYGTTGGGGASSNCTGGCGTVFKVTPQGALTLLHSFDLADGAGPEAGLVLATDMNFYGTTGVGGVGQGVGTVFKTTSSGTLTSLYSFQDDIDGSQPTASLVQGTDGNFYGTAISGGNATVGTVFKITPTGTLTPLYSFCNHLPNCPDGAQPYGGLVQASDGNFYGTTLDGGANNGCRSGNSGCGTVFKITSTGTLTTLYSFCAQANCVDGARPAASLVQGADGNLYGTTVRGGGHTGCSSGSAIGCGTVFKITLPVGTLTTLYSFCAEANCADGAEPFGTLVQASDGNFYGTASGGVTTNNCPFGCGTVFKITPEGSLTTLYTFCSQTNCADGFDPYGALVQATDGSFYGTTLNGGSSGICSGGCGTVFSLGVGLGPFVESLPSSGFQGKPVTILGNNLTGTTSVTFNGTTAAFTVVSDSEIKTAVPIGATSGPVKVTTPGGTLTSNVNFQVAPVAPCAACIVD